MVARPACPSDYGSRGVASNIKLKDARASRLIAARAAAESLRSRSEGCRTFVLQ